MEPPVSPVAGTGPSRARIVRLSAELVVAALAIQAVGTVELRVLETAGGSFHPKAYILHLADGDGVAFVGSSNLSELELGRGIERSSTDSWTRQTSGSPSSRCSSFSRC